MIERYPSLNSRFEVAYVVSGTRFRALRERVMREVGFFSMDQFLLRDGSNEVPLALGRVREVCLQPSFLEWILVFITHGCRNVTIPLFILTLAPSML